MTEQCKNCKFYKGHSDEYSEAYGICRKTPPGWHLEEVNIKTVGVCGYPTTCIYDWCGEYQPIEPGVDQYPEGGG